MPAPVHLGLEDPTNLVADFYRYSSRESIGPALLETENEPTKYKSLEQLVDHLLASRELTHVVVNHGNAKDGLLIKFTANSPFNATGPMVRPLASLVAAYGSGVLPIFDPRLVNVAAQMGVSPIESLSLLAKLLQLQSRKLFLHLRGCSVGADKSLLEAYKVLFGARLITAPRCRMLFHRIKPAFRPATVITALERQAPRLAKTRRRVFRIGPNPGAGVLLIDVTDVDGHTRVENSSSISQVTSVQSFADFLVGRWVGSKSEFILPVLWCDVEQSYHCPIEFGYRERLVGV